MDYREGPIYERARDGSLRRLRGDRDPRYLFRDRIAAVGSSDSHNAGRTTSILQAPIGRATTVVRAPELSERGIECGVRARRTYVKVTGNGGPDLRCTARPRGGSGTAIVGDVIRADGASFEAHVRGGAGRELLVVKDGATVARVPSRATASRIASTARAAAAGGCS